MSCSSPGSRPPETCLLSLALNFFFHCSRETLLRLEHNVEVRKWKLGEARLLVKRKQSRPEAGVPCAGWTFREAVRRHDHTGSPLSCLTITRRISGHWSPHLQDMAEAGGGPGWAHSRGALSALWGEAAESNGKRKRGERKQWAWTELLKSTLISINLVA